MEQTVFNFKGNEVRNLIIDNEPWFVGKDVAMILGYKNSRDALSKHVDKEDKKDGVAFHDTMGRSQNPIVINESGLYSLIFASKLDEAKDFKRWVTSEVLPSIRKYGRYGEYKPKSTSIGEIASLTKETRAIMNKQGSKPYKVAQQVQLMFDHFGIPTIPNFVETPETRAKQLTIAFIETEII